jgi:hypothetical protein
VYRIASAINIKGSFASFDTITQHGTELRHDRSLPLCACACARFLALYERSIICSYQAFWDSQHQEQAQDKHGTHAELMIDPQIDYTAGKVPMSSFALILKAGSVQTGQLA